MASNPVILTYQDLRARGYVRLTKHQLGRLEAQGAFPQRVRLSPRRLGWVEAEVEAWLQARIDARELQQQAA